MDVCCRVFVLIFLCLGFVGKGTSFGLFRQFIPNGFRVPNPCTADNATDIWDRVGHFWLEQLKEPADDKRKNSFGLDFLTFKGNYAGAWTELCKLDSDNDTRTNGDELGDPTCGWTFNPNTPEIPPVTDLAKLSHPGIPDFHNKEVGKMSEENRANYCQ